MKSFINNKKKEFGFIGLTERNFKTHLYHLKTYIKDFFKNRFNQNNNLFMNDFQIQFLHFWQF